MPEDAPSRPESVELPDHRNLPVPLPRPELDPGANGEGWLHRLVRVLFGRTGGSTRSDIEVLLEGRALDDTGFSPEQRAMLKNILGLSERRVEDVMVPRADIVAVHQDISLGELMRVFENAAHSRLVVYDDTLDDPVGLVHIRDLIAFMTAQAAVAPQGKIKRKKPLPADLDLQAIDLAMPLAQAKIIRTILFVPPSMPTLDLLAKMQATRIHLALVIDEYGGTDGLVSIEDLVEQIVGDIEDEHDEQAAHTVVRQPDGSFLADARATLEDVVGTIGSEFDVGEAAEEVDTVGGYLVTRIGRVPVRGEIVPGPEPFEIEVLDADPRRVKKVKISRSKQLPRGREPRREPEEDGARGAQPREAGTPEPPPSGEAPGSPPVALPAQTRQP
jgi:CBS domain containing-hemolysin-like protein